MPAAQNPIPTCAVCDRYDQCGPGVEPKGAHNERYMAQAWCSGYCNGEGQRGPEGYAKCAPGTETYPPLAGLSGYGYDGTPGANGGAPWRWSIVDQVLVPKDLELGDYLLSLRWDCEQVTLTILNFVCDQPRGF